MCNVISEKRRSSLRAPIIIIIIIIIIMYFLQITTGISLSYCQTFYLKLMGSIFFVYIII